MKIEIYIPDDVYQADPSYSMYFMCIQHMVNRLAFSHHKYGRMDDNKLAGVDEMRCARQRISMYDPTGIEQKHLWEKRRPTNTGNTENLLDAANFLLIEFIYPRHKKAHFASQTSADSPGLEYKDE